MKKTVFFLLSLTWLADMVVMVLIGPLGNKAVLFGVLYGGAFLLMAGMAMLFPRELDKRKALVLIFALGLSARAAFMPFEVGTDLNRYVWEGHIQNLGYNPYVLSPDSPVLAPVAQGEEIREVWEGVNHKDLSACYPPFALLLFRALAAVKPDPLLFKIVITLFDVATMIVLALMLRRRGLDPSGLLLYAANPLVIVFIAGEGHLESIQIFFLCLGIHLITGARGLSGYLCLGLAVMSKYFALIAIPFLWTVRNGKKSFAALIPLLLFIPFLGAEGGIFRALSIFGTRMHYNDSITVVLRSWFDGAALHVAVLLLGLCFACIYLVVHDPLRSLYLAFGSLVLFLPTLHPWYLALMAPFLVFFPSQAWIFLMAAVAFTFPVMGIDYHTKVFQEIHWLKYFEYLPFYGLLLLGLYRNGLLYRKDAFSKPEKASVVIPTLNEADNMERCLESLKGEGGIIEIIVVDGGSSDDTCRIAGKAGARVLACEKGRGRQIRKGVEAADGGVICILHADCVLREGSMERILHALERNPHAPGGACGMRFEAKNLGSRLIAALNNVRARHFGISFGDQAQFFRVEALKLAGGFPSMMLMEDVELSMRLKESGRPLFIRNGVLVSSRRWKRKGFFGNVSVVVRILTQYLVERRLKGSEGLKRNYYDAYYSRDAD